MRTPLTLALVGLAAAALAAPAPAAEELAPIPPPDLPVTPPGPLPPPPEPPPAQDARPARARRGPAISLAPLPNTDDGDRRRALGRLEQESLDDALAARSLVIDPEPGQKTIGTIHVVNQEVFSARDWWFQFFNHFHRTTREDVLRRELLLKSGDVYDEARVQESNRNLQSPPPWTIAGRLVPQPELSSVVLILPVKSPRPGQVDLLAVTRDVWSLRFNTVFEVQQKTLITLDTSLSENNLFGWRKFLSLSFAMDQGAYVTGPVYIDPNIRGTRLTLYARSLLYYGRASGNYEGNSQTLSLRYPAYSLATRWSGGVDVTYQDVVARQFRGTSLALRDLAATPDMVEQLPDEFRRERAIVDGNVTRGFGRDVIQRITAGYLIDRRQSAVLANFPGDAMTAFLFLDQYAPISQVRSEPYLRYQVFAARYGVYRDLDTFDLRENRRLGPSLTLQVGHGVPAFGADYAALALRGSGNWTEGIGDGFVSATLTASTRVRSTDRIDDYLDGDVLFASPMLARTARLVMSFRTAAVRHDTFRTRFFVGGGQSDPVAGGDAALRGYEIGEFQGQTLFIGHAEVRTRPLAVLSQRVGAILFWDIGHAARTFATLYPRNDVGIGLRWLIPQLNSSVIRLDWAIPLQDGEVTRAGLPGRFGAGFAQAF